jgi:thiamine biosynthesis protein ThiI
MTGAGGLPTGVSGRVGCLISGGIDSPVAAWRMMKRGCEIVLIHFHSAPFTDKASIEKVEELTEILASWYPGKIKLALIPLGTIQKKIVTQTEEKYRVILYRRFMVRMAEQVAISEGCEALVTGEALGQVASQTLSNITTVDSAVKMPIFRPLIGMDKQEVVDSAKFIGTYGLSIQPHQDCCQFFEPRHPITRTTDQEMIEVEKALNIDELVKEGLTHVEWKHIKAVNSEQ